MRPLIYHNPNCGTSRNTLAIIKASGETPELVAYLDNPPSRERLVALLEAMAIPPRELMRRKETLYSELSLDDPASSDEQLVDAMLAHPILINRPIVVTDKGVALCRPSERVFDLLDNPVDQFTKENGDVISSAKDPR